jgi:hypothetical protein
LLALFEMESDMKKFFAPAPAVATTLLSNEESLAVESFVTNTRGPVTSDILEALRLLAINANRR